MNRSNDVDGFLAESCEQAARRRHLLCGPEHLLEGLLRRDGHEQAAERVADYLGSAKQVPFQPETAELSSVVRERVLPRAAEFTAAQGRREMTCGDLLEALLADVRSALGDDGSRLARLLESADDSLESADELLKMFSGNREELDATLLDLRDTVANLKALPEAVKERPFSLVRVKPEPPRKPGDGVKEGTP